MAYDEIHKLISVISPETYANPEVKDLIRKTLKESKGSSYQEAIKRVKNENKDLSKKAKDLELYNYDDAKKDAMGLWGLKSPIEQHEIVYDSPAEGLEPVYFWILDFLKGPYQQIDKLVDNFQSSPGSSHFSELQGKATQMQQEVSRTMGNVNTVIKSILNLIYDLKEFKLRLAPYEEYEKAKKGQDEQEKYNKLLALKQVWLDNVDIKKGRGSINALSSGELDFATFRDGFMAVESAEHVKKLDLNDRVKRMLQQRTEEFFRWISESEASLKQRYELEKNYLRSQHNMLKLYSRWVKPYLKAAQKLGRDLSGNKSIDASLVTAFNSTIFELVLLATSAYDPKDDVSAELLPDIFKSVKTRKYYKVIIVEFEFRSIPQKISQKGDWAFGGKVNIKFTSYALNDEELEVLKKEIDKDDFQLISQLIEGATDSSLKEIEKDIDDILEGKDKKEKEKETPKSDNSNPFSALFQPLIDALKPKSKGAIKTEDTSKGVNPDNEYEKVIRSQAALGARELCFTVFDVYKKAHGMPSHQSHYDSQ